MRDSAKHQQRKHEWYLAHKELSLKRAKSHKVVRREFLNRAKMKPCQDCGVQYNPWVMDFDHRDPGLKKFTVGESSSKSFEDLKEEIAKCDVVCANCHRQRTHQRSF